MHELKTQLSLTVDSFQYVATRSLLNKMWLCQELHDRKQDPNAESSAAGVAADKKCGLGLQVHVTACAAFTGTMVGFVTVLPLRSSALQLGARVEVGTPLL